MSFAAVISDDDALSAGVATVCAIKFAWLWTIGTRVIRNATNTINAVPIAVKA